MEKYPKNSTSFGFRPFPFKFLSDFLSPWLDVKSLLKPSNLKLQDTNDVQVYTMQNGEFHETPGTPVYCVNMCLKKKSLSGHLCPAKNKTAGGQHDCACECWEKCSEETKRLEAEIERLERMVHGIQRTSDLQAENALLKVRDKNKKVQANISLSRKHATHKTTQMQQSQKLKTIASYEGTFGPDSRTENQYQSYSDAETERPVTKQREGKRLKKEDKKKVTCPWYKNTQDSNERLKTAKYGGGEAINKRNLTCRCGDDKHRLQFNGGEIITGKAPIGGSQAPCYHNYICLNGKNGRDSKLLAHIAKELEHQKNEIEKLKDICFGATKPKVVVKRDAGPPIGDKLTKTAKSDGHTGIDNKQETKVDAATLKKEYREAAVLKTPETHEPNLIAEKTAGTNTGTADTLQFSTTTQTASKSSCFGCRSHDKKRKRKRWWHCCRCCK